MNKRTSLIACALGASLALTGCTGTESVAAGPTKSPAPSQSTSPSPSQSESPSNESSNTDVSIDKWNSDRAKEIATGGMVAVTAAFDESTEMTAANVAAEKVKLVDNVSALQIVFNGFKGKLDEETREKYHTELQTLADGVSNTGGLKGPDLASLLNGERTYAIKLMGRLADIEESVKSTE